MCLLFLLNYNQTGFPQQIFVEVPISNFKEIHPVEAMLIYVWKNEQTDEWADGQKCFS
jgi:hypothetical protein